MFLESTKELVGVCDERSLNRLKMFQETRNGGGGGAFNKAYGQF